MHNQRPVFSTKKAGRFLIAFAFLFSLQSFSEAPEPSEVPEPSDNFFLKADANVRFGVRPLLANALAFPALGYLNAQSALQATENLYFTVSAFGRVPVQASQPHVDAFADLGDSYMKYTHPKFVFTLGQIRVPWRTLRASALNDRLNPVDYRRGIDFSQDINSRVPQWGFQMKGTVLGFSTDAVYFLWHRPSPASLVFMEQDGVQIGHYQGAIARNRQDLASLFAVTPTRQPLPWFSEPTVAVRAQRHVGEFDLGFNVIWGFDDVPLLTPGNILTSGRSLSFGGESSYTLGVAILKAEAVFTPQIGNDIGKTTLLRSSSAVISRPLTNARFGFGVDAEYGESISGSLELIDSLWFDVPAGFHVHAIEALLSETNDARFVQRLALAFALNGKLFSEAIDWNWRGEMGIIRPDLLTTIDLQHDFTETGFYVGAFANLFFGVDESPGWYRSPATEFGVKAGYHL